MNLIPDSLLYFGLSLALAVMLLSLAIAAWVLRNRQRYVVRASQPFFMVQLCVGTFILASTIIPMGWQEPKSGLDAACQATPWLFCTGLSVAVSAIFGKARRINQLIGQGTGFRRCEIKPLDVMKPFFILMCINVSLLTAWTASPGRISWHRITVDDNVDKFGRIMESYGVCRADSDLHFLFSAPLVGVNVVFLGMATWQSYKARALPSELSEATYLTVTMVFLTETFWLGITSVFAVMSHPTAYYVLASVLIFVGSLAILGPMFGPKWILRNMKEPRGQMASVMVSGRAGRVSGLDNSALDNQTNHSNRDGRQRISSRWTLSKSGSVGTMSGPRSSALSRNSSARSSQSNGSGRLRFSTRWTTQSKTSSENPVAAPSSAMSMDSSGRKSSTLSGLGSFHGLMSSGVDPFGSSASTSGHVRTASADRITRTQPVSTINEEDGLSDSFHAG